MLIEIDFRIIKCVNYNTLAIPVTSMKMDGPEQEWKGTKLRLTKK